MDINQNLDLLNTYFIFKRFTRNQRAEAVNIAKVSKNLKELKENLKDIIINKKRDEDIKDKLLE